MSYLRANFRLILGAMLVLALLVVLSPDLLARGLGQAPGGVPGASIAYEENPNGAVSAFAQIMLRLADGAAALAATVAIFFVVLNGARLSFSFGNTEALGKAKKGLLWASAGLILIIFAYVITKSVVALTYSGADGSSVIGTDMIEAPGSAIVIPLPGEENPGGLCRNVGALPEACVIQDFSAGSLILAPAAELNAGTQTRTLQINNQTRSYNVHVPSRVLPVANITPVLFVFHGQNSDPASIAQITNFNALAQERGFIVVYPQAINDQATNNLLAWQTVANEDLDFIATAMAEMRDILGGYAGDFYVAGMADGAAFSQALACEISAIKGVASVAGALQAPALEFCNRTEPLPFIGFYGTADSFNQQPAFESAFSYFSTQINTCSADLQGGLIFNRVIEDDTLVARFSPAGECETPMNYYRINDGGHTWPGGLYSELTSERVTRDINASRLIAEFFNLSMRAGEEGEPPTDIGACNQAAVEALAGVCSDLEVTPCNMAALEINLATRDLSSLIGCDAPDSNYDSCTKRGIEELYRTQCIR